MDLNELAKSLFGKDTSRSSVSPGTTTTVYGTAMSDSENGEVQVFISDDAVGPDFGADPDATVITLPTSPSVKMGDTVAVTLLGGGAVKHPYVSAVIGSGDLTTKAAEMAQSAADAAEEVANRTQEHFWFVETGEEPGVHITEVPQEEWSDPDSENYHSGANQLSNSAGILLRDGLTNFAQLTPGETAFYDGEGNAAENVVATFGTSGSVIGKAAESHVFVDYHSLQMVDKLGDEYFNVSDLRDHTGKATISETFAGDGTTTEFVVGFLPVSNASCSVEVEGTPVAWTRPNLLSKTFTLSSAPAYGDTVTITYETGNSEAKALTFGVRGTGSVGGMSTAEGRGVVASGLYSHAEGYFTIAQGTNQTAIGRYNVADPTSALIIGNGTSDNARSNALSVGWDGFTRLAGRLVAPGATLSQATITTANVEEFSGEVYTTDRLRGSNLTGGGTYNLNIVFDPGIYWCYIASSNTPIPGTAGMCIVSANLVYTGSGTGVSTVIQTFQTFGSRTSVWTRYLYQDNWTSWIELGGVASEDSPTLSGSSATTFTVRRKNGVATLYVRELSVTTALASGSSVSIATISSGYRPAYTTGIPLTSTTANAARGVWLYITSGGAVSIYNRSGNSLATSSNLYGTGTYVL